jgi:hypothetical protein
VPTARLEVLGAELVADVGTVGLAPTVEPGKLDALFEELPPKVRSSALELLRLIVRTAGRFRR